MPYKDPEKRKAYSSAYHKKDYAKNKKKHRARIQERKDEIVLWFRELKETLTCERCPENNPVCLDFDHLPEHKRNGALTISKLSRQGYSKKRILEEIAKCRILCANCHRKETHKDY